MEDHYIEIKDVMINDEVESDLNLRVKIICNPERRDILGEYMLFCKIHKEQKQLYGNTIEAIEKTIKICMDKNILKEYLDKRKHEVVDMVSQLITMEDWILRIKEDSKEEGREEGREKERKDLVIKMLKNKIDKNVISLVSGFTLDEISKIEEEI